MDRYAKRHSVVGGADVVKVLPTLAANGGGPPPGPAPFEPNQMSVRTSEPAA